MHEHDPAALHSCIPEADAGFLIMESNEYPPISGANTIATATALLETGMLPMREPNTMLKLDTAAGLITVHAECEAGKCKNVAFDNVPSFVYALNHKVEVPEIGMVSVYIAWGGMHYVLVDATSVGLKIDKSCGPELVRVGEKIKAAVGQSFVPIHPERSSIREVTILDFTESLQEQPDGSKAAVNTVVVSSAIDSIEVRAALERALAWQCFMREVNSRRGRFSATAASSALSSYVIFVGRPTWDSMRL